MWFLIGLNLWLLGMVMICLADGHWKLDEFLSLLAWPVMLPITQIERWSRRKRYGKWDDDGQQEGGSDEGT